MVITQGDIWWAEVAEAVGPAALADPRVGPLIAAFDDVTVKLTPSSWLTWDMGAVGAQAFGGLLGATPGYLLPLD